MGGIAAEEHFFGESSSGGAADLLAATEAACQMIGALGMGSTLISAAAVQAPTAANLTAVVLSNDSSRDEVEELLRRFKAEASTIIESNSHVVEALRDALLEHDELIGNEITEVIVGSMDRPRVSLS